MAEGAVGRAEAAVARIEARLQAQREVEAAQAAEGSDASEAAPPAPNVEAPPAEAPPAAVTESAPEENTLNTTVGISVGEDTVIDGEGSSWQDQVREAVDSGELNVNTGSVYFDERIKQSLRNPDLALYRVQESASKYAFLLAPLSLPFIALLFLWKRGTTFYDHVVYALYALSFASLLFITLMLGAAAPGANVAFMAILSNILLLVALPVHAFFQLKGAYVLGWFSALWRTFFMMIFAVLIASVYLLIIILLGLLG